MKPENNSAQTGKRAVQGITGLIVVLVAVIVSLFGGCVEQTLPPTATFPPTAPPTETAPPATEVAEGPLVVPVPDQITQGFSAAQDFWAVYFTAPTGSRNRADYVAGIDGALAAAINNARGTLDIAAFEFNNPILTEALLAAQRRGVRIRMVTDDEHGLEDEDSTIPRLIAVGIPVVDDERSALMHNKFIIIDSTVVWTGSTNLTINGVYRNNNNLLMLRSRRAVESYQAEFDEMFTRHEFGPRSSEGNDANFTQDGVPIRILFAAEDDVVTEIINRLAETENTIRFMAFSFTLDEIRNVILQRAESGVSVQGIFETVGSETRFAELTPLFCAGLPVRQDGSSFILHHKVFILDDNTVITGSFNFSASATQSNDENLVIIEDADVAAQYIAEFDRRWAEASTPDDLTCS